LKYERVAHGVLTAVPQVTLSTGLDPVNEPTYQVAANAGDDRSTVATALIAAFTNLERISLELH